MDNKDYQFIMDQFSRLNDKWDRQINEQAQRVQDNYVAKDTFIEYQKAIDARFELVSTPIEKLEKTALSRNRLILNWLGALVIALVSSTLAIVFKK